MLDRPDLAREMYGALARAKTLPEMRAAFDAQGARFELPPRVHCSPVQLAGRPAEWWRPEAPSNRVIYYLHGGGYILGSLTGYRHLAAELARASGASVLLLDYRLAPEHVFPAALDDAVAGYRELLGQGIAPERVAFAGDSAGGNLVMTTLLSLRDSGLPLPGCAACFSPWTDYETNGDSMVSKASVEPAMTREALHLARHLYFGKVDPSGDLATNILGADLSGLPPLLVQVGSHEVLMDDSIRLVRRAALFDVDCTLQVWSRMIHVFQLYYPILADARRAIGDVASFTNAHTDSRRDPPTKSEPKAT